jgi:hypothetical protein
MYERMTLLLFLAPPLLPTVLSRLHFIGQAMVTAGFAQAENDEELAASLVR